MDQLLHNWSHVLQVLVIHPSHCCPWYLQPYFIPPFVKFCITCYIYNATTGANLMSKGWF